MADTYTYAGARGSYFKYTPTTAGGTTHKARVDDFSIVIDYPAESITPVGSSIGDAGSAKIVSYSGSFNARLLVSGSSLAQQRLFGSTNDILTPTYARFECASKSRYVGPIILSNITVNAAGAAVVKYSGSWNGADGFAYSDT